MLKRFDALLITGGNPYYLRSLMKITGADEIITDLMQRGAVYAGASAAAVVAGPRSATLTSSRIRGGGRDVWDALGLRTASPLHGAPLASPPRSRVYNNTIGHRPSKPLTTIRRRPTHAEVHGRSPRDARHHSRGT